ncbi:hypothetical protein ACX9I7_21080 [Streptomyces sp. L500]
MSEWTWEYDPDADHVAGDKSCARGLLIVWYLEDRRDDVIVVVRVTAPWAK